MVEIHQQRNNRHCMKVNHEGSNTKNNLLEWFKVRLSG